MMKVKSVSLVAVTLALCASMVAPLRTAFAAAGPQSILEREIDVQGQIMFHPYSFVLGGTTYMPIWYVMQALDKLSISTTWHGIAKGWYITAPDVTVQAAPLHHYTGIYINNVLAADVPAVVFKDPGSGVRTTYMPIWYVMRMLTSLSIRSTWKNGVWDLIPTRTTGSSISSNTTGNTSDLLQPSIVSQNGTFVIDGQTVPKVPLQNEAADDRSMWAQAGHDFYISAQTNDPAGHSAETSLLSVSPGQTLYLFAYKNGGNVEQNSTLWTVNSPYATVTPGQSTWTRGNYDIVKADFTAVKPGIYTVQATSGSDFSVPLVIIVGLGQLAMKPFAIPSALSGIAPLSPDLQAPPAAAAAQVTYTPYAAVGSWIPIQGSTKLPISSITVQLQSTANANATWDYRLPVVNGQFSGEVRSPFSGSVQVTLFPNYLQTLTKVVDTNAAHYLSPDSNYSVTAASGAPTPLQTALLASSQGDYNMSNRFSQVAATLLENSPSIPTAIAAISNYVSESLVYNSAEAQMNAQGYLPNYVFQDNVSSWQSGSGICQDYATLTASLLQSVGIPAQTLGGYANSDWTTPPAKNQLDATDAHEWLQAYTGSSWMIIDPTWNDAATGSVDSAITSEFTTATDSFQATHLLDPTQIDVPIKADSHK